MTAGRIALTELRRLTSGRLPRLAVLALVLVPLLYGALYVYANWDPYSRLHNVPAAIVNADTGAKTDPSDPKSAELHAGQKVVDQLRASDSFGWQVTDAADADTGVHDGRYGFALVIPPGFSAALASPGQSVNGTAQPEQAQIRVITNDANNYLVGTIANQVVAKVKEAVSSETGAQAADRLLIGFSTIYDKTRQAADGAGQLANGAGQLTDGSNAAHAGADKLAGGAQQLATGANQLNSGQRQLQAGAAALADGTQQAATGTAKLQSGSHQLSAGLGTLQQKTAQLPQQTRQLADGAAKVADGNEQLAAKADVIANAAQTFVNQLGTTREAIHQQLLAAGFTEAQAQQVLAALDQLNKPITDANGQLQSQIRPLDALAVGSRQVANGAAQLAQAAPALSGGIAQASDGSRQLTGGIDQLATGVNQLNSGAHQLKAGEDQAVAGSSQLAGGSGQLANGANQLADGTKRLADGSAQLTDGSRKLADGLGQGAQQIPHPDDQARAATAQTIGDPVKVDASKQSTAGTYGSGLAPFFLALALWVGGYVLFLLVKPLSTRALASRTSPWSVALGGWLAAAALGVAQAVLLFLVAVFGLGVHAAHPWAVLGLMVFASLSYIALLHALNALFGSVGKFLGLILLILQLISAGGTFPWQTTPDTLHPLHYLLPMSYVTDALRHLLYGAGFAGVATAVTVLASYLVAGLLLSTVAAYQQRSWTAIKLKPELAI